ncbi:phosphoribosylglycinamide formyltransferase [Ferruginivarius sediminum]|uniref:Phosphoribosylglycinamide formyltransferase n=1 Tax=Ferruginivarius sediminum TaxID=2661937 RepID=A0A369TFA2_9PROT|nr:phosphoribosylglycinamide formyltransferase [Ferruginivarius sediminum]RDD62797.1 phosphoribosylglycinamide formyltransferase [Ferruginivarius sediminum]
MARVKVGALISGRGSNLQALIDAAQAPDYPVEIACVISNRPDAAGLDRAEAAGIPAEVVDHTLFPTRAGFEGALSESLVSAGCELVCLAGFMRVLTASFVELWRDRLINIHPSLLPAFPGLDTHAAALAAGVKIAGCTVHFVRETVDAGPIIGQAAVPVLPGDDADSLAARVLGAEHRLYPHCLGLVASGRTRIVGQRVEITDAATRDEMLVNPPL